MIRQPLLTFPYLSWDLRFKIHRILKEFKNHRSSHVLSVWTEYLKYLKIFEISEILKHVPAVKNYSNKKNLYYNF